MQEPNSNDTSAQPPRSALSQDPDIANPRGDARSEPLGKTPDENAAVRLPGYRREKRPRYVPVKGKFIIATTFACLWFLLSWRLAQPWLGDLAQVTGYWQAVVIIFFIALLPGFLNAHIVASVILDRPPPLDFNLDFPTVSLLIAAYNEEENILETMRGIKNQDYPGGIEIIVVDDGSTDSTVDLLQSLGMRNLKVIEASHGGKAHALNEGLKYVSNEIVVCIDADTYLHPQALKRIVARFLTDPPNTAAVAGCVLVKNSRSTFMTRMQEWDYFTGIASAKRQQSLYQGTLVAQGAFSAFRSKIVKAHQGWPSVIGEDIVLTWALIKSGWRIGFEPTAVGFTTAPESFKGFYRQRKRWARGMIEGLKRHGHLVWSKSRFASFFVGIDFMIPFMDLFYMFVFLPGVVLALMGHYYIVGPLTLLVVPLAFLIVLIMYRKQKAVFNELGLKVRQNFAGFIVYMLIYQAIMSPICVIGYAQELIGMTKRW
ncbi:MAG TPA: glycosyltransferase family 2 protein [Candidatus Binatia bacterium]|nr:glycosyltransferase family 2 protein [Candidatus Binatia bacterium]